MIQVVALLSVFGLGMAFSIIGALKLELVRVLNIDDAQFGKLISALMFASLIVVLIIGPLVDLLGYKPIAIVGFAVGFASVFMLISTGSYSMALLSCVILGIGAMCLNLGNTLLPIVLFGGQNAPAASNFGNVFFGLGAFITPFLIGLLLSRIGYKATGTVIAVILLVPIIFAVIAKYPEGEGGFSFVSAIGLLSRGTIITAGLALFCYIGLEVSMGGWITTYASSLGFADKGASMVLSGFWISMMVARLAASRLITPEIGASTVAVLALIATVVIGLMVTVKSKTMAAVLVILTGLAFGPIFPTIVGVTFSKTDQSLFGSAFGIIFAIGLLGGSTIPAAIGSYAKGKTIQKSMAIAAAAAFVLFIIGLIMGRV